MELEENVESTESGAINGIVAMLTFVAMIGLDYLVYSLLPPLINIFEDPFLKGIIIAATIVLLLALTFGLPIMIAIGKSR